MCGNGNVDYQAEAVVADPMSDEEMAIYRAEATAVGMLFGLPMEDAEKLASVDPDTLPASWDETVQQLGLSDAAHDAFAHEHVEVV